MFFLGSAPGSARFDENDARNRLLLCMLKIREYRLTRGRFPARLGDLGIAPPLLVDPYTGGQITYRRVGNDYLLYCLGPDGKDDGGLPADERNYESLKGDIGVRPFRTPEPQPGGQPPRYYRRVPHMLPPKLPANSPPLLP